MMIEQIHNSKQNISVGVNEIRKEVEFTDLSFACRRNDQSFYLHAHQAIFSTLSTQFKELFKIANLKQPYEKVVVIIDSVDSKIMEILIEYIYKGEVNVNESEILKLAELCSLLKLEIPIVNFCKKAEDGPLIKDVQGNYTKLPLQRMALTTDELPKLIKDPLDTNSDILDKSLTMEKVGKVNFDSTKTTDLYDTSYVTKGAKVNIHSKCEFLPYTKNLLRQSYDKKLRIKKFAYRYQGIIYGFKGSSKIHCEKIKTHNPFMCKFCGKILSDAGKINDHIKLVHDRMTQIWCEKCSIYIATKYRMPRHIREVHENIKREKHPCKQCMSI